MSDDDDDDGDDAVPPPSVSIGGRRGTNNLNPSSPLSGAGRSGDDDIGDVGVNIFAPLILPNKPKLATLRDLKDVVPHPKGTRGKKPTAGDFTRQLNEANKRIEEMAGFVTSVSNSMREYTKSVKVVVDTSHKQLVKTHASLMKTVENNVKTVGDLSNKLDTAERKVVSTKDHLTFELQKAEAMAELGLASHARTIKELQLARTHYMKERGDAVAKLTKVRVLFLSFILLFLYICINICCRLFLSLSTKVSIQLKEAQLDSTHSKTVAKNIKSESKGKQKKSMEELQYASQLNVEQHQLKTHITAQAKEAEKQRDINKKRSRINTSQSVVSLTGRVSLGIWE